MSAKNKYTNEPLGNPKVVADFLPRPEDLAIQSKHPKNLFSDYHAHVYFDEQTVDQAASICEQAGTLFGIQVGRVHRKLVGPHPRWSCQLGFTQSEFDRLIPWLDEHRQGLTVLVHGVTGHGLTDHTTNASWLGAEIPLNLSALRS